MQEDFWPWLRTRLLVSLVWFIVLEVVNAMIPNGLLPHWLAVVLGLVAGFLSTWIFVAVWGDDSSSRSSNRGGSGGSFLDDLF